MYVLDHGISVSKLVNKPVECTVKDGVITGEEIEGTVELTGDSTAKLTINGEEFSGVIIDMTDEAGNKTRSISAVGANNHTIWAVSYIK
jgi:arabinan endo-1,5-alpha-L-arabinosidase